MSAARHLVDTSWARRYVGLPFRCGGRDRAGVDCWGLVCLVYAEMLSVKLPPFYTYDSWDDMAAIEDSTAECQRYWSRLLTAPSCFDVALFWLPQRNCVGLPHVGIVLDERRMLHAREGANSCIQDRRILQRWADGCYRLNPSA